MLVEYSDQFGRARAHRHAALPAQHQVPHCESDSYVFLEPVGPLRWRAYPVKYYFAVENPFGVSARSLCVILIKP